MLRGPINHVSITVSDLPLAMAFLRPVLEFLGYAPEGKGDGVGVPLVVSVNPANGIAFNGASKAEVDRLHALVVSLGGEILDPPGEFPYAVGGYYACYFRGPDRIKFECVYMPELEKLYRERGILEER